MAALIKLANYQTFTLYEATRPINFKMSPEPMPEEHMLLDENRCGARAKHYSVRVLSFTSFTCDAQCLLLRLLLLCV